MMFTQCLTKSKPQCQIFEKQIYMSYRNKDIVVNLYLAWDLSRDEALLRYVAVGQ